MKTERSIQQIIYGHIVNMGGMHVRQPLPSADIDYLDPFVLLHHHATVLPDDRDLRHAGVGAHPHRGFSPVTFLFRGSVRHRDSRLNDSTVHAGGVQWMNAGMGIVHSERPLSHEQELIQMWVNTPARHKMDPPAYHPLQKEETPTVTSGDGNVTVWVVTGELLGAQGPIPTLSPIISATLELKAGGQIYLPLPTTHNAFLYLLDGQLQFADGQTVKGKNFIVLTKDGEGITLEAVADTRVLLMTGEPIGEEIVAQGPFVMNSENQIMEAYRDFRMGKMGVLIEE